LTGRRRAIVAGVEPIAVHEFGTPGRPTLVLVHGLTESGAAWPDAVARWGARWHLLAVDLRGHGSSPRFGLGDHHRTPDVWLADLLGVLRALPAPPVVVGHSLGGLLALRAATTDPALVRALVLEDPARPSGASTPSAEFTEAQEELLDRFRTPQDAAAERARMAVESHWTPAEIAGWAAAKPQVDRTLIRRGLFLGDPDLEYRLARVAVPTLLVAPEDGVRAPRPQDVANPHVRMVLLPGVSHNVRRDDPAAFHAVVDPFLEAHRLPDSAGDLV